MLVYFTNLAKIHLPWADMNSGLKMLHLGSLSLIFIEFQCWRADRLLNANIMLAIVSGSLQWEGHQLRLEKKGRIPELNQNRGGVGRQRGNKSIPAQGFSGAKAEGVGEWENVWAMCCFVSSKLEIKNCKALSWRERECKWDKGEEGDSRSMTSQEQLRMISRRGQSAYISWTQRSFCEHIGEQIWKDKQGGRRPEG